MPQKDKPNYTELTHQVVQKSRQPLRFDEILGRVHALTPIKTKNPKSTIRNAVSQSRLIVATGDGRYGWMPRVINGSALRITLADSDLTGQAVEFGDEVRDALWPTFFESQKRSDRRPVHAQLPDQSLTDLPLDFLGESRWGTAGSPEFWKWFKQLKAKPGDHLIFRVIDGEAKRYGVEFQRRKDRDEPVIAERNQSVVQAALAHLRSRPWGAAIWETTSHLLATGQYRHPVPPDPLSEIWTRDLWEPVLKEKGYTGGWVPVGTDQSEQLAQELFGAAIQTYDVDRPPDLPREYDPDYGRRPRASQKGRAGPLSTYVLRVNHRALPKVWRDIEIAEDQTLEDLHLMIQRAYNWSDDHLYSFFMSGKAWDQHTEIGSPWSDARQHTHQVTLGSLNLKPRQKFLYLFDYGDNHEFDVQVRKHNPSAPQGNYPRVVDEQGKAPPQYPDYDEETGEPEWDV
ncbi:MAG TPA: plasmid pRiA4b ORF-3 family protein [Anaerolineae bacterium]|nr:plasmid pRiA4b ORF-3 family protein [Anaerolineae bacterium]